MRLTSKKIQFVLAALVSMTAVACDGGGDDGNGNTAGTGNVGNSGSGGASGGSGGSGPAPGATQIVSDFETASTVDGVYDGYSEDTGRGWKVAWFTYTDAADGKSTGSMILPLEGMRFVAVEDAGRTPGTHVANAKGSGFLSWGAGMGFNFASPAVATDPPAATDISAFKGVSFWIKSNVATTGTVKVKIVDKQNTPTTRGGTCTPGMPTAAARCDDVFLTSVVPTDQWTQVTRLWADFQQEGWGMLPFPGPELNGVIGIQFQVGANVVFDFSVDDVSLVAQ